MRWGLRGSGTTLTDASAAHVLRRTSFGPYPGQVAAARAAHRTVEDLVDAQLETVLPFEPRIIWPGGDGQGRIVLVDGGPLVIDGPDPNDLRHLHVYRNWWVQRMLSDDAALHEKMMWLWHGIFTCSSAKVDRVNPLWQQLRTFHEHALGNFRDLALDINIGGAMIMFLDGMNSNIGAPNENQARELMELFTLGFDQFTQDDVAAAARVLAGWSVGDDNVPVLHPERALVGTETVRGVKGVRTVEDLIDAILQQDECGPFVVGRLWDSIVGGPRDERAIARWGTQFHRDDYEIAPLLRTMLTSDEARDAVRSRPRTGIEWWCAAVAATGDRDLRIPSSDLTALSHLPYFPPSVAGWPASDTWLSSTQSMARVKLLESFELPAADEVAAAPDSVAVAAQRCSLDHLGDETRRITTALDQQLRADPAVDDHDRGAAVLSAVLLSPEQAFA